MTAMAVEPSLARLTTAEEAEVLSIIRAAQRANAKPEIERIMIRSMTAYRTYAVRVGVVALAASSNIGVASLVGITDRAWNGFESYWIAMTSPAFKAQIDLMALRSSGTTVPSALKTALAEEYARRTGRYFNMTAKEAVKMGFTTYVNRKVPVKAAAERVIKAIGLNPRQMASLVNSNFDQKSTGVVDLDPSRQTKRFIEAQISQRFKTIAGQESYNITQEALHVTWLYQVKEGAIPATAKKIWLTAKDERVCPVCGPMHQKTVGVMESFELMDGTKAWFPGVHVNCRCTMRLSVNTLEMFGKADYDPDWRAKYKAGEADRARARAEYSRQAISQQRLLSYDNFDENEHPRASDGTFTHKPKASLARVKQDEKKNSALSRTEDLTRANLGTGSLSRTEMARTSLARKTKEPEVSLARDSSLARNSSLARDSSLARNSSLSRQVENQMLARQLVTTIATSELSRAAAEVKLATRVSTNIPTMTTPLFIAVDIDEHTMNENFHETGIELLPGEASTAVPLGSLETRLEHTQGRMIDWSVDSIITGQQNQLKRTVNGEGWTATLSQDDVETVVRATARGDGYDHQSGASGSSSSIPVKWTRSDGHTEIRSEFITDLANDFGINKHEFVQRLYMMTELPEDAQEMGSRGAWQAPGDYDAVLWNVDSTKNGIQYEIIKLTPKKRSAPPSD